MELDLTRARIGAGTSVLELVCVMGSITVRVPAGVRVECDGNPIVGSVEVRGERTHGLPTAEPAPDAPLVRITGTALLGAIDVVVVDAEPPGPGLLERLRGWLPGGRG